MKVIDTSDTELRKGLKGPERFFVYNGLDSMLTHEVFGEIEPQLRYRPSLLPDSTIREFEDETYEFSRAMQAPLMEMMAAGLRVDDYMRGEMIASLTAERAKLEKRLLRWIFEALELTVETHPFLATFNYRSNAPGGDLQKLFYEVLALPQVLAHNGKPTVDRDAMERLSRYPSAAPIVNIIFALRDIDKDLSTLRTEIDTDGRIRTTLSIAGTNTGRIASYTASNGRGTNLQNITESLRKIFCADTGWKFAYIDLEQAESRLVGAIEWSLFGDGTYLDACESDDLHTTVAKMVWKNIQTREEAEQDFARGFSYRFMCKRIGHGSNYYGTPRTISAETAVPFKLVDDFQVKYFDAFPAHRRWHRWVAQQLVSQGFLVSLMGRKRWFMGRANDDSTLREAVAFDPQSSIADLLNRGLYRLWWKIKHDPKHFPVRALLQIHDALLIAYPEKADESVLLPRLIKTLETPIILQHNDTTRPLIIPAEAKIGWNWGERTESNVDGLVKWSLRKPDLRTRQRDPTNSVLDSVFHGASR